MGRFVIGFGVVLRLGVGVIGFGVVLRVGLFVIGLLWARRAEARTCGSRSMAVMPAARGAARARHPYSGQRGRGSVRWLRASMGSPVGDVIVLGGARELGAWSSRRVLGGVVAGWARAPTDGVAGGCGREGRRRTFTPS